MKLRRSALLMCALALLGWGWSAVPERRTIKLHYTPRDRETGRYQYVPFDVAEGTTRLSIEYRYDRAGDSNVIDLGLFEPGPLDLGTARCRGWSGGERTSITLTPTSATPGYWPGHLPPGRWNVLLGLYKIAEAGVDVEVVVETGREPEGTGHEMQPTRPSVPPPRHPALRPGPAWYRGGLHMHTVHSDGKLTVRELSQAAREAGLDFIAITDHNNTAHQAEKVDDDGLLRIVGEEVTTPGGHASVWGLGPRDWIDFRVLPGDARIESLVAAARDRGALFSINHPRSACVGCSWEHAIPKDVAGIEIWNGRHGAQEAALSLWDSLLREGRRLTGVGSSDWHRPPDPLGNASVRVWARELLTPAILEAIREGRVVAMADGTTPPPGFILRAGRRTAMVGETLTLALGESYEVEVSAPSAAFDGARADIYWNGEAAGSAPLKAGHPARFARTTSAEGYVRMHVHASDGSLLAITNPIYVKLR